ncbi:Nitrate reductase-like protein NarX [compost metagenome]
MWFRGMLMFGPDASLMQFVPLSFKIHIVLGLLIFALWPFTRLVHVWSVPLNYAWRRYIVYRSHRQHGKKH